MPIFTIDRSLEILTRTPDILEAMLSGISDEWSRGHAEQESWNPYDIVGHLIHGEETDWIPRMRIILSDSPERRFEPFDRFAQFKASRGRSLAELLVRFRHLRTANIERLKAEKLTDAHLERTGIHPTFGAVNLRQLLATWVVHDLNHLAQIVRVMAGKYRDEVGPWTKFLGILSTQENT